MRHCCDLPPRHFAGAALVQGASGLYALIARAAASVPAPTYFWYTTPSFAKRLASDGLRQTAGVLRSLANDKIVRVNTSKLYCSLEKSTKPAVGPAVLLNH
jgi:hypothetical protein